MNPDSLNNQLPAPIENNDENKLAIPTNQIGVPVGTSHTTPNQVVPSGLDSTQSSFSLNPMTAEDDDLIEKPWVHRIEKTINQYKDDPFMQLKEISAIKSDYLKKRFNKITSNQPGDKQ